jgi:hypothetical protein
MLNSSEDLGRAAAAGCAFALVELVSVELRLAGTRSQRAIYRVVVRQRLRGAMPDALALTHHGPPMMQPGDRALVGARDGTRFSDSWHAEYLAPLSDGDEASEVRELEATLSSLENG